jgi:FixJ family two-component response regulator
LACKNLLVDNGRPPSKTITVDLTVNRLSDIPVISIIDDDELVRDAVKSLVRSLGYTVAEHASAEDYLRSNEHGTSSCLITDIQMPGMSGADLQTQLIADQCER